MGKAPCFHGPIFRFTRTRKPVWDKAFRICGPPGRYLAVTMAEGLQTRINTGFAAPHFLF